MVKIFHLFKIEYDPRKKINYLLYTIVEHLASRRKQDKYFLLFLDIETKYGFRLT